MLPSTRVFSKEQLRRPGHEGFRGTGPAPLQGSTPLQPRGACLLAVWGKAAADIPGGREVSGLILQVMDSTEKFHVQTLLLLQLRLLAHQLLSEALQRPAAHHLWGQWVEDLHVFHVTDLAQTREGRFFLVSTALGLAQAILGPFRPTQDRDDGLTEPGVLLQLQDEVPVALEFRLQVTDFPF